MDSLIIGAIAIVAIGAVLYVNYSILKLANDMFSRVMSHLHSHSRVGDLAINVHEKHLEEMKRLELDGIKIAAAQTAQKAIRERMIKINDPQA